MIGSGWSWAEGEGKVNNQPQQQMRDEAHRTSDTHGYVILQNSERIQAITKILKDVIRKRAITVGDKNCWGTREEPIVYRMPCAPCIRNCYGMTKRGMNMRLGEHKTDQLGWTPFLWRCCKMKRQEWKLYLSFLYHHCPIYIILNQNMSLFNGGQCI